MFIETNHNKVGEKPPELKEQSIQWSRFEGLTSFQEQNPELTRNFLITRNEEVIRTYGFGIIQLPVEGGLLLGANAGEWSGSLQYVPDGRPHQLMTSENVLEMQKWCGLVLIASGVYGMGLNYGELLSFSVKDNKGVLAPWFVLPSCPLEMGTAKDGRLVIVCTTGTMIFSTPDAFTYLPVE